MHAISFALLSLYGCGPNTPPATDFPSEAEDRKITLHVEGMAERLELF